MSAVLALSINIAHAGGKLSLYHWFEYIPAELLEKFESETGIDVTMDTFDSNESMLAALKAGKMGSYDLAVPGDYMVEIMTGEGMLDTIATGELKNKGNIEQQWLDASFDPGRKHSIPYQWGSTSFSVNRDVFKGNINTSICRHYSCDHNKPPPINECVLFSLVNNKMVDQTYYNTFYQET